MTKHDIWKQLLERHPELRDEKYVIKLKSRGLKALIDQAWDEGSKKNSTDDLFSKLFGGSFGGR